jgi:hypothetical protein
MLARDYSGLSHEGSDDLSFLRQRATKLRDPSSSGGQSQSISVPSTVISLERWRTSNSRTVSIPQMDAAYLAQLDLLQRLYTLRGKRTEILRFLECYPFLVPLLLETYIAIQHFFPYTLAFLEISNDPDEPDNDQILVSIGTELSSDEAVEKLEAFDRQWWLEMLKWTQNRVCITLEFK